MSRNRGLWGRRRKLPIREPREQLEARTESEEALRSVRDWLRDRDDNDRPEWERDEVATGF